VGELVGRRGGYYIFYFGNLSVFEKEKVVLEGDLLSIWLT
jgi:hypothetical protein